MTIGSGFDESNRQTKVMLPGLGGSVAERGIYAAYGQLIAHEETGLGDGS